MASSDQRFVPKVHPAARAAEEDDPMTVHATAVVGDPDTMIRCLVEEYARMGWDAARILGLFRDPAYPALYALWQSCGEEGIRRRIKAVLRFQPVFHFAGDVRDTLESTDHQGPQLVDLGIPAHWRPVAVCGAAPKTATDGAAQSCKGGSHAKGQ
jgi:hypothetical protein